MSREAFENYMALYWKLNGRWPDSETVWNAAISEHENQIETLRGVVVGYKQRIAELEKDCDILAQNHEADRREIERLKSALSGMLGIVADSQGVAGYHLNGEISEWGEFEEIDAAYEALKGEAE